MLAGATRAGSSDGLAKARPAFRLRQKTASGTAAQAQEHAGEARSSLADTPSCSRSAHQSSSISGGMDVATAPVGELTAAMKDMDDAFQLEAPASSQPVASATRPCSPSFDLFWGRRDTKRRAARPKKSSASWSGCRAKPCHPTSSPSVRPSALARRAARSERPSASCSGCGAKARHPTSSPSTRLLALEKRAGRPKRSCAARCERAARGLDGACVPSERKNQLRGGDSGMVWNFIFSLRASGPYANCGSSSCCKWAPDIVGCGWVAFEQLMVRPGTR